MRLAKSRHGGKGQRIDMQFAPLSLALVPMETSSGPYLEMARQELAYNANAERWEDVLFKHRQFMANPGSHRRSII
jgi:hypothetical protein